MNLDFNQQRALASAKRKFLNKPGVTAVTIGFKETEGRFNIKSEPVLRIHVEEKLDSYDVDRVDLVPQEFMGLSTDVVERSHKPYARLMGDFEPLPGVTKRSDLLYPALSVGHGDITAGTLGAIVYDKTTGAEAILSNWHILMGASGVIGDPIYQPGPYDLGLEKDDPIWERHEVANLTRGFVDERGDAAIAIINTQREASETHPIENRVINPVVDDYPRLGEILEKDGRTTGHTSARVTAMGFFNIKYDGIVGLVSMAGFELRPINHPLDYDNNIEISAGGDSGAIWYRHVRRPRAKDSEEIMENTVAVGLNTGGEMSGIPSEESAIACYARTVAKHLNIAWDRRLR